MPCEYLKTKKGIHPHNKDINYEFCLLYVYDGEFGSHEQACPCNGDKNKCPFINIRPTSGL